MKKKYKIGIALSGGGARGFAHLGVLQYLYEIGIKPDIIAGTSAGAIVGAFIANGCKPKEVFDLLKDKKFTDYTQFHFSATGLLSLGKIEKTIKTKIKAKNIQDLEIPFIITATNLNDGVVEYFSQGELAKTVLASSSIPVLFSPVKINDKMYADGGMVENLPVKPLVRICEKIISVNIHPIEKAEKLDNLLKIATRTFQLGVHFNQKYVESKSSLYIEPEGVAKYSILDTKKSEELFELAYNYCKKKKFSL